MKRQQKGVKFHLMHGTGQVNDMDKLIETWLYAQHLDIESDEYADMSWAVDALFDLAHDNPDELLTSILAILKVDSSPKTLGAIGAGALEDLLVHHGCDYIDKIVELSKSDPNFKASLSFTYIDKNDVSPDVYEKFQGLMETGP